MNEFLYAKHIIEKHTKAYVLNTKGYSLYDFIKDNIVLTHINNYKYRIQLKRGIKNRVFNHNGHTGDNKSTIEYLNIVNIECELIELLKDNNQSSIEVSELLYDMHLVSHKKEGNLKVLFDYGYVDIDEDGIVDYVDSNDLHNTSDYVYDTFDFSHSRAYSFPDIKITIPDIKITIDTRVDEKDEGITLIYNECENEEEEEQLINAIKMDIEATMLKGCSIIKLINNE